MTDRMALIAQLGAAMESAEGPLKSVLRDALSALVEDHGIIAAHERNEAADEARRAAQAARTRKHRNVTSRDVTLQGVTERDVTQGSPSPLPSLGPQTPINPSFPPTPPTTPPTDRPARAIRVVPAVPRPDVDLVLAHYVGLHPRRKPGPVDRRAVEKALGLGYSAAELCEALSGNATDEWHRTHKKHDVAYVLRNNGQIDNFRARSETVFAPQPAGRGGRVLAATEQILE